MAVQTFGIRQLEIYRSVRNGTCGKGRSHFVYRSAVGQRRRVYIGKRNHDCGNIRVYGVQPAYRSLYGCGRRRGGRTGFDKTRTARDTLLGVNLLYSRNDYLFDRYLLVDNVYICRGNSGNNYRIAFYLS